MRHGTSAWRASRIVNEGPNTDEFYVANGKFVAGLFGLTKSVGDFFDCYVKGKCPAPLTPGVDGLPAPKHPFRPTIVEVRVKPGERLQTPDSRDYTVLYRNELGMDIDREITPETKARVDLADNGRGQFLTRRGQTKVTYKTNP